MGWRAAAIAPTKLATLFTLLTGMPLLGLAWLGWSLIDQEGNLDHQRLIDALQQAGSVISRELDRSLGTWDLAVGAAAQGVSAPASLPPHAAQLVFNASGVIRTAGVRLPYVPAVATAGLPAPTVFAEAEADEFGATGNRQVWGMVSMSKYV